MNLKDRLQRMLQIVEDAECAGTLADIERDILLAELQEAYAELKFGKAKSEEQGAKKEVVEPAVAELPIIPGTPDAAIEENDDEEPEVEVELIFNEEDDEEEIVVESAVDVEPAVDKEIPNTPGTPKRNPLLSLYEDESTPVLGEQFHEAPSVADTIACPKGVAESTPVASLREAIGVADKFMLIRELFGGDADAYEVAITALEAQSSFDDCIIYIAENYTWSPNAESTKFVMELLQRKYNA